MGLHTPMIQLLLKPQHHLNWIRPRKTTLEMSTWNITRVQWVNCHDQPPVMLLGKITTINLHVGVVFASHTAQAQQCTNQSILVSFLIWIAKWCVRWASHSRTATTWGAAAAVPNAGIPPSLTSNPQVKICNVFKRRVFYRLICFFKPQHLKC